MYRACSFSHFGRHVGWNLHARYLCAAMSGFIPRTLLFFYPPKSIEFWAWLFILGGLLIGLILALNKRIFGLDLAVLWGFIVSPLVHDYDLIQLIPLLDKPFLPDRGSTCFYPGLGGDIIRLYE